MVGTVFSSSFSLNYSSILKGLSRKKGLCNIQLNRTLLYYFFYHNGFLFTPLVIHVSMQHRALCILISFYINEWTLKSNRFLSYLKTIHNYLFLELKGTVCIIFRSEVLQLLSDTIACQIINILMGAKGIQKLECYFSCLLLWEHDIESLYYVFL